MTEESQAANLDIVVSVIVPAFNAAVFIAQALNSVLHQQGSGLEVLVVDDDSTDATVAALFSLGMAQRRFCLVRSAAALGEMAGHRQDVRRSTPIAASATPSGNA